MSRTLYFGKVNISKVYEIYKDEMTIEQVMNKLFICIKDKVEVEKVIEKSKEGDTIVETHKFSFSSINKLNNIPKEGLVGAIIKSHQIYVNQIDKNTGVKKVIPVDNDEIIEFFFSPYEETIAFYTSHKFGYLQICEAFEMLINKCSKVQFGQLKDSFKVSMRTNGVSMNEIKKDLANLGPIKELTIRIIPPNPISKVMQALKENTEEKIKNFEQGRVTEEISIFRSEYVGGLDTATKEIGDKLDNVIGFHTKISDEELTGNGYVNVKATPISGEQYNTDTNRVIKVTTDDTETIGDVNFANKCRGYVKKLFKL